MLAGNLDGKIILSKNFIINYCIIIHNIINKKYNNIMFYYL